MSGGRDRDRHEATETQGGELLFHDLFDDTPEAEALAQGEIVVFRRKHDPDRYDFITPGIEQLTGYRATEITPLIWDSLVQKMQLRGELAGVPFDEARHRYKSGSASRWHAECLIRRRDGGERWILDLSVPLRAADGRVIGSFGFLQDISAHRQVGTLQTKHAEPTLTDEMQKKIPSIVWTTDAQLNFLTSDGPGLLTMGLKPGQMVGMKVGEFFGSDPSGEAAIGAHHLALSGMPKTWEQSWAGRSFTMHVEPICSPQGKVTGVLGLAHDVTTQHEAEVRLLQREAYERALLQAIPDMLAVIDADGTYLDFKADSHRPELYPVAKVVGRNMRDFPFHEPDRERVSAALQMALRSGVVQEIEYQFLEDGVPAWWEARIARLDSRRVVVLARNIDERKKADAERRRIEEQMRSAQQLESLGVLAGGIAHDFNNLLVGILGNAELALKDMPEGRAAECITEVRTAATRAAELTNLMLAYAGRGKFQTTTLDLNVVACEVTQLVQAAISKKVALHFELDRTLPNVRGDVAQLRQVVMNLIINAAESFGDREGDVYLRTGIAKINISDAQAVLPAGAVHPGRYIFLEVRDTGCGMDDATIRRIFDPFFTTKFTGRGLGLSASLGILRSHNGGIHVESIPGAGSTFSIFLPPAVVSSTSDTSLDIPKRRAVPSADITGRILVVDDEEIVRRVVKRQLERAGFSVLCEADGRQAVQLIADQPDLIDLVLLDLTMPGMGGEEVLIYLRSIGFKHPVVLMSGYDESEAVTITKKLGVFAFIRKPFQNDLLVNTLRAALAAKRPPAAREDRDPTIAEDRG